MPLPSRQCIGGIVAACGNCDGLSMDTEELRRLALDAITARNEERLKEWCFDFELILLDYESWPESLFAVVAELLVEHRVVDAVKSFNIPKLLHDEADGLTPSQKERLLPLIEKSYPRFRDCISCMCLAELLGRFYANTDGFLALRRLRNGAGEEARAFAAYGLRLLIQNSDDERLRKLALEELRAMRSDVASVVRGEVEHNLRILEK